MMNATLIAERRVQSTSPTLAVPSLVCLNLIDVTVCCFNTITAFLLNYNIVKFYSRMINRDRGGCDISGND